MNLKELYQEIILEHGKNPRNLGKTENFNKDAKGNNPLCGDNVHVYLKLNDQRKVEDISFEGKGCAISMASASIMTDLIKGKSDNEAKEIIEDFLGMIKENPDLKNNILDEDDKTKLMCLSGVKQYPMRVKCATLSWHTLVSAMKNDGKIIEFMIDVGGFGEPSWKGKWIQDGYNKSFEKRWKTKGGEFGQAGVRFTPSLVNEIPLPPPIEESADPFRGLVAC